MAYRGCDAVAACIIEGYNTAVAEGELDFTLALLTGDAPCHGAVNLVGQPVLAGNGFE